MPDRLPQTCLAGHLVLLADDNAINSRMFSVVLRRLGATTDFAHDGVATLECLRRKRYDLVLMDVCMPGIDGLECVRRLRELESTEPGRKHSHVVAVTGSPGPEEQAACVRAGMDDFLGKPVEIGHLVACVARYLKLPLEAA